MIEVYNKADLLPEAGAPLPAHDPSPAPGASAGSHPSSPDLRQHSRASASERSTSARQQHHSVAASAAEDRSGSGDALVGASAGADMDGLHAGSAAANEQLQEIAPRWQAHGAELHEEAGALCPPSAACALYTSAAAGSTACGGHAAEQAALGAGEAGAGECPSAEDAYQDGFRGHAAGPHAPSEGPGPDGARAGVGAAALPRVYTSTVTRAGLYELLREIDCKARASAQWGSLWR